MYESGLLGKLDHMFQTWSTSPIPGLVRVFVLVRLVLAALVTF